ncbi:MAG: hypothetical protein EOP55_16900 [Sphingobacteriales bacterium]|nr:MAG: hypothetical protein EOP55_16900 [Sphingobacteriales bacterium]
MIKKIFFFVFVLGLASCNQREESKANTELLYFDIKGFFAKESLRLKKTSPLVNKEVLINGIAETKQIRIADWEKEFTIFTNADINKASWKGSFKSVKNSQFEHYTSNNKKIPVKDVLIEKADDKRVKKVVIIISTKNILYTSGDTLFYYPDSLYKIVKHQKIRLLSPKDYQITGKIR